MIKTFSLWNFKLNTKIVTKKKRKKEVDKDKGVMLVEEYKVSVMQHKYILEGKYTQSWQ